MTRKLAGSWCEIESAQTYRLSNYAVLLDPHPQSEKDRHYRTTPTDESFSFKDEVISFSALRYEFLFHYFKTL